MKKGTFERFFLNDESLEQWLADNNVPRGGFESRGYRITRYKGLGEMNPETLWETTLDPANRMMCQVTVEDALESEKLFSLLMGADADARREFIEINGITANLDV